MNTRFFLYLFLILLVGCLNKDQIAFETLTVSKGNGSDAPLVAIHVPKALKDNKISAAINKAIKEEIVALLIFDEDSEISTIDTAIGSFTKEFLEVKEKFLGKATPWEAKVEGAVLFENDKLLTIALESYVFTGGAHGYGSTTFLNFDKIKGRQLKNSELFVAYEAFVRLVDVAFRKQEKIPLDVPINDTGFMFEAEVFSLPQNIGFTPTGVQLLYNAYEVASYADGQLIIVIPYAEANSLLKIKVEE